MHPTSFSGSRTSSKHRPPPPLLISLPSSPPASPNLCSDPSVPRQVNGLGIQNTPLSPQPSPLFSPGMTDLVGVFPLPPPQPQSEDYPPSPSSSSSRPRPLAYSTPPDTEDDESESVYTDAPVVQSASGPARKTVKDRPRRYGPTTHARMSSATGSSASRPSSKGGRPGSSSGRPGSSSGRNGSGLASSAMSMTNASTTSLSTTASGDEVWMDAEEGDWIDDGDDDGDEEGVEILAFTSATPLNFGSTLTSPADRRRSAAFEREDTIGTDTPRSRPLAWPLPAHVRPPSPTPSAKRRRSSKLWEQFGAPLARERLGGPDAPNLPPPASNPSSPLVEHSSPVSRARSSLISDGIFDVPPTTDSSPPSSADEGHVAVAAAAAAANNNSLKPKPRSTSLLNHRQSVASSITSVTTDAEQATLHERRSMKPIGLEGVEGQTPKSATKLVFDAATVVGLDRRARSRRGGSIDSAAVPPQLQRETDRRASADAVVSTNKISLEKYRQVCVGYLGRLSSTVVEVWTDATVICSVDRGRRSQTTAGSRPSRLTRPLPIHRLSQPAPLLLGVRTRLSSSAPSRSSSTNGPRSCLRRLRRGARARRYSVRGVER
jgi:hypothetical protein